MKQLVWTYLLGASKFQTDPTTFYHPGTPNKPQVVKSVISKPQYRIRYHSTSIFSLSISVIIFSCLTIHRLSVAGHIRPLRQNISKVSTTTKNYRTSTKVVRFSQKLFGRKDAEWCIILVYWYFASILSKWSNMTSHGQSVYGQTTKSYNWYW